MLQSIVALSGWNASLVLLLVKATIILIAALGITLTMRRASATARHLVWLVTLGTLLLVPALTAWGPLKLSVLPARIEVQTPRAPSAGVANVIPSEPAGRVEESAPSTAPIVQQGLMNRAIDTVSAMSPLALFAMVWAIVVAGILVSLAWAGLAVRRIVRNARTLQSDDWMTPLLEISDRLALEEPPRLLQSDTTKMPFACGMLKATIVLPADSEQWTLDRRRAVLLHELAHVRRHDLLGHTLGRIACAVYWFHPLVWTAAKRLRNESERACDDLALSCGTRATDYAEHLLDIVTTVRGDATPLVALAMARRKEFEGRMLAILDPDQRRAGPTRKQSAALIAALALIALTVGATSPVARAASAATVASNVEAASPVATPEPVPVTAPAPQANAQKKAYPDSGIRGVSDTSLNVVVDVKSANATSTSTSISTRTNTNTNVVVNSKPLERAAEALANQGARFGVNVASAVLESLGGKGEKGDKGAKDIKDERTDLLAKVLRTDSSASLRRTAAWALAERTNNQVAVDALVNALRKDTDARVREMAAWALGDGGDHSNGALEALTTALKSDASEKVRATSAWALGQLSDHASTDALAAALGDPDSRVRERAAWALGEVGERHAPKALVALLGDKEPRVRTLAAWALYSIEDPSTAPALQAAMKKEQNQDVQVSMLRALSALGEQSVDAIKDLLDSPDPKVKQMAVRALAGGRASGPWPWPWPDPRPFP